MVQETRSKVVVRLLPPSLSEDGFKKVISEWLETTDWLSYWKGKPSAQVLNHSRAYLNFKDPADVFRFKAAFNGKHFVTDKTSQQYRCIVEYAPYQRISRKKGRYDNKENTVEKDEDYKEFLAKLQAGPEVLPSAEVQLQQKEAAAASVDGGGAGAAGPTQTALMQYLKEKRAKKISKKIQRDPASTKGKGRGGGGGGAAGGEGGKAKKGKQRKTKKANEAGSATASRGEEHTGKGGSKKDKKSKKNRKDKKAGGGGGGGSATEQPPAPTAIKILQRQGTSPSLPDSGTAAAAASGAAAAPKPKVVPIALPPRSDGAQSTAGGGDGGGSSKRGGRGKGRGGRGVGRGEAEAAAAGAGEEGGGGGGRENKGGGGRGGGRRGGRGGRGRGGTAPGSQPKVVPIVIVRKPKAPQPDTGPSS